MGEEEGDEGRVEDRAGDDDLAVEPPPARARDEPGDGAGDQDERPEQPEAGRRPQVVERPHPGEVPEPAPDAEEEAEVVGLVDRRRMHRRERSDQDGHPVDRGEERHEREADDGRRDELANPAPDPPRPGDAVRVGEDREDEDQPEDRRHRGLHEGARRHQRQGDRPSAPGLLGQGVDEEDGLQDVDERLIFRGHHLDEHQSQPGEPDPCVVSEAGHTPADEEVGGGPCGERRVGRQPEEAAPEAAEPQAEEPVDVAVVDPGAVADRREDLDREVRPGVLEGVAPPAQDQRQARGRQRDGHPEEEDRQDEISPGAGPTIRVRRRCVMCRRSHPPPRILDACRRPSRTA